MNTRLYYHFTAAQFITRIKAEGLTRGMLPWNLDPQGRPTFKRGFQWLTTNPSYDQAWCLLGDLPFPKNAYRLTILIPLEHARRLVSWRELCLRCAPDSAEYLNSTGGDTENWFLFFGKIHPSWFLEVARNSGEVFVGSGAQQRE